jgi:hypothetical protein
MMFRLKNSGKVTETFNVNTVVKHSFLNIYYYHIKKYYYMIFGLIKFQEDCRTDKA